MCVPSVHYPKTTHTHTDTLPDINANNCARYFSNKLSDFWLTVRCIIWRMFIIYAFAMRALTVVQRAAYMTSPSHIRAILFVMRKEIIIMLSRTQCARTGVPRGMCASNKSYCARVCGTQPRITAFRVKGVVGIHTHTCKQTHLQTKMQHY